MIQTGVVSTGSRRQARRKRELCRAAGSDMEGDFGLGNWDFGIQASSGVSFVFSGKT
jgi:hypothetical protein